MAAPSLCYDVGAIPHSKEGERSLRRLKLPSTTAWPAGTYIDRPTHVPDWGWALPRNHVCAVGLSVAKAMTAYPLFTPLQDQDAWAPYLLSSFFIPASTYLHCIAVGHFFRYRHLFLYQFLYQYPALLFVCPATHLLLSLSHSLPFSHLTPLLSLPPHSPPFLCLLTPLPFSASSLPSLSLPPHSPPFLCSSLPSLSLPPHSPPFLCLLTPLPFSASSLPSLSLPPHSPPFLCLLTPLPFSASSLPSLSLPPHSPPFLCLLTPLPFSASSLPSLSLPPHSPPFLCLLTPLPFSLHITSSFQWLYYIS